jgi:hypothetical protein
LWLRSLAYQKIFLRVSTFSRDLFKDEAADADPTGAARSWSLSGALVETFAEHSGMLGVEI